MHCFNCCSTFCKRRNHLSLSLFISYVSDSVDTLSRWPSRRHASVTQTRKHTPVHTWHEQWVCASRVNRKSWLLKEEKIHCDTSTVSISFMFSLFLTVKSGVLVDSYFFVARVINITRRRWKTWHTCVNHISSKCLVSHHQHQQHLTAAFSWTLFSLSLSLSRCDSCAGGVRWTDTWRERERL